MTDLYLWVDNEDSTGTWSTTGSPPYLSTQDQPSNYIYSTSRNANSGVYSFQGTSETGTINSVTLYFYAYGVATSNFEAILSGSGTGLGPPAGSWTWRSVDVSSILTSWAQINAATIYFDRPNTDNDAGVDACYLLIDYTPAVVDRNVSEADGLTVGESVSTTPLVLADVSPSDGLTVGDTLVDLQVSGGAEPDRDITGITDNVNIGEAITAEMQDMELGVADGITLGETTSAEISAGILSVSDGLAVGDAAAMLMSDLALSVSDGLAVGEDVTMAFELTPIAVDLGIDNLNAWVQGVVVYG